MTQAAMQNWADQPLTAAQQQTYRAWGTAGLVMGGICALDVLCTAAIVLSGMEYDPVAASNFSRPGPLPTDTLIFRQYLDMLMALSFNALGAGLGLHFGQVLRHASTQGEAHHAIRAGFWLPAIIFVVCVVAGWSGIGDSIGFNGRRGMVLPAPM